jgi:tetratricopeptide (TPR) repeat protein
MSSSPTMHHYNPDWLSDDDLLRNFAARLEDFTFLRNELARAPREGSAQHYLLVGVRGAGKTTLLKRLAVALRRDADLNDHLIALSFPEELYQVKNLSDFWWAACDALLDELDRRKQTDLADRLSAAMERGKTQSADPLSDGGLQCLQQYCAELGLRPVLLVDNLDMVFERIDKSGRKLKDTQAPAYWALRESLSTTTAPIVIGGSVRLSEPFVDVDKAFYDFFIPKRLGKLSLDEVNAVLTRLADLRGMAEIKQRLQQRPSRVEALYELTGGNPRALGLIFELLRQGPNSRAVEDFEQLMDITTPYYKARFEDLAEQAQVVMHALAVCRSAVGLRFGLTAAEVGQHSQLATSTVSAQLDNLAREGLVEKTAAHGRTQYRIAEQLFRLWLQMRGNRRIRQNVLGLTRFLEAMFSLEELQEGVQQPTDASSIAGARLAFAAAGVVNDSDGAWQRGMEAKGIEQLVQHLQDHGGMLDEYLSPGDVSADVHALLSLGQQLRSSRCGLDVAEQEALVGAVKLRLEQKQALVQALLQASSQPVAQQAEAQVRQHLARERQDLMRDGMHAEDLGLFYHLRALACLPLPFLRVQDCDVACQTGPAGTDILALRGMLWRLLGAREFVKIVSIDEADALLEWGRQYAGSASANEWANVAGALRRSGRLRQAKKAIEQACVQGETARTWYECAALLDRFEGDYPQAEQAYRKAIELDPTFAWPWNNLGNLLTDRLQRHDEAEKAYRKAIELDPTFPLPHYNLGRFFSKRQAWLDAANSYARAWALHPNAHPLWNERYAIIQARLCAATAQQALEAGNTSAVHEALAKLLAESVDIAAALASEPMVENFLAPALTHHATQVLPLLRELDFAKHARPLLLAAEAVAANRLQMLDELEPELQSAARRMAKRLTLKKP